MQVKSQGLPISDYESFTGSNGSSHSNQLLTSLKNGFSPIRSAQKQLLDISGEVSLSKYF